MDSGDCSVFNQEFCCVWSNQPQPLTNIIKDNKLPFVVKVWRENVINQDDDSTLDFTRPLLLYKELRRQKVYSRIVSFEKNKGRVEERDIGTQVIIPQEYPGLFLKLDNAMDRQVKIVSIATIARVMPASFLSMSTSVGFVSYKKRCDTVVYRKRKDIPVGAFYVMNVYEDFVTYVNSKGSEKRKLVLCLRCIPEDRKTEVLFPFDWSGILYIIDHRQNHTRYGSSDCVPRLYRISDLISSMEPNQVVKLIRGDSPTCCPLSTGILRFSHVVKEHTVIGCSLQMQNTKLFELPVLSSPQYNLAVNTSDGNSDFMLKKCTDFMNETVPKFLMEMRVRKGYGIQKNDLRE